MRTYLIEYAIEEIVAGWRCLVVPCTDGPDLTIRIKDNGDLDI